MEEDFLQDARITREIKQFNMYSSDTNLETIRQSSELVRSGKKQFTEESLRADIAFLEASRIIAKRNYPEEAMFWDDEQTVDYGLEYMGQVNYNLPMAISTAVEYDQENEENLAALAYMVDAYDEKEISLEGFGRFAIGIGTDPTTYLGITALGSTVAKTGALASLKHSLFKTANLAAIEGGVYTAIDDAARQMIQIDVGQQEEYDPIQGAIATTIGAAAGKTLVEGAEYLGRKVIKKVKKQKPKVEGANNGLSNGAAALTAGALAATIKNEIDEEAEQGL